MKNRRNHKNRERIRGLNGRKKNRDRDRRGFAVLKMPPIRMPPSVKSKIEQHHFWDHWRRNGDVAVVPIGVSDFPIDEVKVDLLAYLLRRWILGILCSRLRCG
jgi:hypothetical protein